MSESGSSGGEKSFEPTEKRLEDARAKGDIAKSAEISVVMGYLGLLVAIVLTGSNLVSELGKILAGLLGQADHLATQIVDHGGSSLLLPILLRAGTAASPLFVLPAFFVIGGLVAQRAITFAPEKLLFKASRVSPLAIARNRFGPTGLFEFSKSFVKLVVLSLTIAAFLSASQSTLLGSFRAEPGGAATLLIENLMTLMWWVLAIAVVIAGIDWFWQQFDHRRKLMMSRQDILDEAKNAEGDPHLKQARRQRGYDIATQRMMADVPTADVVIVNPQHFAVALKWDRDSDRAPVCVAKGVDEIAARIREIAAEAAVPIHRDAPTARALFATVPIGDEIPQDHYKAVAAAIRFAEKVRSGAKRRNQT